MIKREKLLTFKDAASLHRDLRNKIHIQEMHDMSGMKVAVAGGLIRVIYASSMVMGKSFGKLGEYISHPTLPVVDILVSIPHFYPSTYPMSSSDKMHILHKGYSLREKAAVVLDEWFILPQLVKLYAWSADRIIGKERPIIALPPRLGYAVARLIGWYMGDVFLTWEEVQGLIAGTLAVDTLPVGQTKLTDWAKKHAAMLGKQYTNELTRRIDRRSAYRSN